MSETNCASRAASIADDVAQKVLRQNIREYGMYIALFVIMVIFTITTKGMFISSRNISNLLNQAGYIAVLAVGMTLVIVIRHIDLSVGFLAGFLGAIAAIAMVDWGPARLLVIPLCSSGRRGRAWSRFPGGQLGIPSFVASLAGWLIYRGVLLLVTAGPARSTSPTRPSTPSATATSPISPGRRRSSRASTS